VRVLRMARTIDVDVAEDEGGHSLLPDQQDASDGPVVRERGMWMWNLHAPLKYPPEDAHRLAHFRGRLRASIVTRSETVELDDLSKPLAGERKVAGVRISFANAQPSGNGLKVPLTLYRDAMTDQAWEEVQAGLVSSICVGEEDNRNFAVSVDFTSFNQNQVSGAIEFRMRRPVRAPGAPTKLSGKASLEFPTEVEETAVSVEFADLPLP
jgi:hypothetical protein